MSPSRDRLLVFARAPVAGACKRRLIPALGPEGAAALHRRLVIRTLKTATAVVAVTDVELWCAPDRHHPFFTACATRFGVALHDQHGADLGARMAHALETALQRSERAVLIGSDCPDLDRHYLEDAFARLTGPNDAVLGPAKDGGYVLIGLRRPAPALFEGIAWGGPQVAEQTRLQAANAGLILHELEPRADIDRPEDLIQQERR